MKPGYFIFFAFYLSLVLGLLIFLSLATSSSRSDGKPIDHSPAMQAKRRDLIRQLQQKGIIHTVECDSPQRFWILPAFHILKFDDKSAVANMIYAYCFPTVATRNVVLLKDKKTGKTAGHFSQTGLEMK
jgi:hypothetical protein